LKIPLCVLRPFVVKITTMPTTPTDQPHTDLPLFTSGVDIHEASAAMILLHGRGATAQEILFLADLLKLPDFAFLAPQAGGNSWYPYRFTVRVARNEPFLTSALDMITDIIGQVEESGIPLERIVLGGFSQGACLVSEYAVRYPARYGGLLVFSGGLIGPPGTVWGAEGSLDGTPVFVGCSDRDPHIPLERVYETSDVLTRMGGEVTSKIYPNLAHTVHPDEIDHARKMLSYL